MYRIANALLALRNAGHEQYITWSYSFYFEFDVYSVLDNQAIKMEHELEQWKDVIAKSCKNCYVLNLFTTQQLRVIRQQLGQLQCERIFSLPLKVISMLMSISPKISEKDIKESLQLVTSKRLLLEKHSSSKLVELNNLTTLGDYNDNVQMSWFNPENEVSKEAAIEKLLSQLINQLNSIEYEVYIELKKSDYPDYLAYMSIKYCTNVSSQKGNLIEAASAWCLKNENEYMDIEPGLILNELQAFNTNINEPILNTQSVHDESDNTPITQSQNEKVYLMEQKLIKNDIPSGLAREGAELYPDDVGEALSYCLNELEKTRSSGQSFLQLPSIDGNRYLFLFYKYITPLLAKYDLYY